MKKFFLSLIMAFSVAFGFFTPVAEAYPGYSQFLIVPNSGNGANVWCTAGGVYYVPPGWWSWQKCPGNGKTNFSAYVEWGQKWELRGRVAYSNTDFWWRPGGTAAVVPDGSWEFKLVYVG